MQEQIVFIAIKILIYLLKSWGISSYAIQPCGDSTLGELL